MEAFTKQCSSKIAVSEAVLLRCCNLSFQFTLWHGRSPVNLWHNFGKPSHGTASHVSNFYIHKTGWLLIMANFLKNVGTQQERRLEDALKIPPKRSWRRFARRKIVKRKTSSRRFEPMSWRLLQDVSKTCLEDIFKQNFYWGYLCLTNLNVYLTNLYFPNLHLTNLRRIQNTLISNQ